MFEKLVNDAKADESWTHQWRACRVEGEWLLGRSQFLRRAGGFGRGRGRPADGQRRAGHLEVPRRAARRRGGPQGTHDVDRLGAVGDGPGAKREDLFTGVRELRKDDMAE